MDVQISALATNTSSISAVKRPTLSVGIANYNHARYLPRAIDSILSQSRLPIELIIVDDASTDDSSDVIQKYSTTVPYLRPVFQERNGGFNAAISKAVSIATGDYFFSLAADDYLLPGAIENLLSVAERYPNAGLVVGQAFPFLPEGKELPLDDTPYRSLRGFQNNAYLTPDDCIQQFFNVPSALSQVFAGPPLIKMTHGVIYRREAFDEAKGYRAELGAFSDGFLNLAIMFKWGAAYLPRPCVMFLVLPESYGNSTFRNFPVKVKIYLNASKLMTTEFCDRFPPNKVLQWKGFSLWTAVQGYIDLTAPYQQSLRFDESAKKGGAWLSRCMVNITRRITSLSLKFYEFLVRRAIWRRFMEVQPESVDQLLQELDV